MSFCLAFVEFLGHINLGTFFFLPVFLQVLFLLYFVSVSLFSFYRCHFCVLVCLHVAMGPLGSVHFSSSFFFFFQFLPQTKQYQLTWLHICRFILFSLKSCFWYLLMCFCLFVSNFNSHTDSLWKFRLVPSYHFYLLKLKNLYGEL